jgi:hypothetical protein
MTGVEAIHQVAGMAGIPRRTTDAILGEVRANYARLDGCELPHDFTVAIDRVTKQRLPEGNVKCFADWECRKCGGVVDGIARRWYQRGLADAQKRQETKQP